MRALTLWQPWASLIALGAKTIETRSWSTKYRGPIAIHAAARRSAPGTYGEWHISGYRPEGWLREALSRSHATNSPIFPTQWEHHELHLGAIVAVAELWRVVPILDDHETTQDGSTFVRRERRAISAEELWLYNFSSGRCMDITSQTPYGDFTPGRFAWLLTAVRPLPEPLPAKGRQGLWTLSDELAEKVAA